MKNISISILCMAFALNISSQLSAKAYELWLNSSYIQQLEKNESAVLLSQDTSTMGKLKKNYYGPTKVYSRGPRPFKNQPHLGAGKYVVYINNVTSKKMPDSNKSQYMWVGMDSIYSAVQSKNPVISVGDKRITLDPEFFAALLQDYANGNNPDGFVSGNIELLNPTKQNPGIVDQDNLDSSMFE